MPFTSYIEEGEPFFSPDGKRLYFMSRRSTPDGGERVKENIWYVEVLENGFSDPIFFNEMINRNEMHWQFSFDNNKDLFFGSSQSGGYGQNDIYLSRYEADEYLPVENLGDVINTDAAEFNPIISKTGNFLIFTRMGGVNDGLFISKKDSEGNWSNPHSMNDLVFDNAMGAMLSPEEKYLFFLGREGEDQGIYWVDIREYIEELEEEIN